jgi:hypothetical protein
MQISGAYGKCFRLIARCAKIEARAKERYERELAEHQAKLAAREVKEKATGKKPGGKPPKRTFIVSDKRSQNASG